MRGDRDRVFTYVRGAGAVFWVALTGFRRDERWNLVLPSQTHLGILVLESNQKNVFVFHLTCHCTLSTCQCGEGNRSFPIPVLGQAGLCILSHPADIPCRSRTGSNGVVALNPSLN